MRELFIDIETFSSVILAKSGVYPCADHDDFELLLFGYLIDGARSRSSIAPTDTRSPIRCWPRWSTRT